MSTTQLQQPFAPVRFNIDSIQGEEAKMEIHLLMSKFEQARTQEATATGDVQIATAKLLSARADRQLAHTNLVRAFGDQIREVAMEFGWEPFRDAGNKPAVENFMSERDQRNLQRGARLQASKQVMDLGSRATGLFEPPQIEE